MKLIYQNAAQIIIEMIPEDWEKIYLYAQMDEDSGTVFFYYLSLGEKPQPVKNLDIPKNFKVDEDEFFNLRTELDDCFFDLWEEFQKNGQECWINLTYTLDNTGDFNIDYGYEDLTGQDSIQIQTIWEYKNLGIIPEEGSYKRSLFEKYLEKLESEE